jgi:hypothetical protein
MPASKPFVEPTKAWEAFFTERFNAQPSRSFFADFNGDGNTDAAYQIGGSVFVFHDTSTTPPTAWEALYIDADTPVEVKDSAWTIKMIPELSGVISEEQSVLAVGDPRYATVHFWYPKEASYAWLQPLQEKDNVMRYDGVRLFPKPYEITANNLSGPKGFYGVDELKQYFVGDFDGNKDLELVMIETGENEAKLWHYFSGATPNKPEIIEYAGMRLSLHYNQKPKTIETPFESDDIKAGKFTIKGDYIESSLPEKSAVYLVYDKSKWKVLWMAD